MVSATVPEPVFSSLAKDRGAQKSRMQAMIRIFSVVIISS
jgi:hypothetical protein